MSSLWWLSSAQWRGGKGERRRERGDGVRERWHRAAREGGKEGAERGADTTEGEGGGCVLKRERKKGEEGLIKGVRREEEGRGWRKGRGVAVRTELSRSRKYATGPVQEEERQPCSRPRWAYHQDIVSQTMALSACLSHQSD